jgi:hypothetical protein
MLQSKVTMSTTFLLFLRFLPTLGVGLRFLRLHDHAEQPMGENDKGLL